MRKVIISLLCLALFAAGVVVGVLVPDDDPPATAIAALHFSPSRFSPEWTANDCKNEIVATLTANGFTAGGEGNNGEIVVYTYRRRGGYAGSADVTIQQDSKEELINLYITLTAATEEQAKTEIGALANRLAMRVHSSGQLTRQ